VAGVRGAGNRDYSGGVVSASIPPVLDPVIAAAQRDLDTLLAHAEFRRRARRIIAVGNYGVPETTLGTPEVPSVTGMVDCASCGESIPVSAANPDPDPDCGGEWCNECVFERRK
jgi:hypothetical protein